MKKKPSSIEWLVDQFKEYDFSEEDGMYLIKIPSWLLAEKEEKEPQKKKNYGRSGFWPIVGTSRIGAWPQESTKMKGKGGFLTESR